MTPDVLKQMPKFVETSDRASLHVHGRFATSIIFLKLAPHNHNVSISLRRDQVEDKQVEIA